MNRRLFLFASGGLSLSPLIPQKTTNSEVASNLTRQVARHIVSTNFEHLPAPVRKEAAVQVGGKHNCRTCAFGVHETAFEESVAGLGPGRLSVQR